MRVEWSDTAIKNYRENIKYLLEEWNYKVMVHFIDETDNCISTIQKFPGVGSYDERLGFNKFLVVEQIYLFYEVINDILYIHNVWNNKRHPYWLDDEQEFK